MVKKIGYISLSLLLELEVEFRIPLRVTEYGAEADGKEGDLSIYAYLSLPFQYNMIRFVAACDQLSPVTKMHIHGLKKKKRKHILAHTHRGEEAICCYIYCGYLPRARVS